MNRVPDWIISDLDRFLRITADAWTEAGLIKQNSWGVEVLIAKQPNSMDFGDLTMSGLHFGYTLEGTKHDLYWYKENAHGNNLICAETGMDSHEAVYIAIPKQNDVFAVS